MDMAVKLEIIKRSGAWFSYNDMRWQGRDNVREFLTGNPEVMEEIAALVKAGGAKKEPAPAAPPPARGRGKAAKAPAASASLDILVDDDEEL